MAMTGTTAKAFWVVEPGRGELRTQTLPQPGPGEVVVRALYGGISRGTEALVFGGRVPPSEYARMRAPFQAGDFPAPVKYGYANVGVVESGVEALIGTTVFCLYPHQDRYVVPADAVVPLPADLPAARAVLAANMETAVNAVWDARVAVGDRVAVVGAGVVGLLTAWLCAGVPGTRVQVLDPAQAKAEAAAALGLDCRSPSQAEPDNDLVIHASGNPEGLRHALALAGDEATVLEMSWFGDQAVALPLGEAFHSRRLTLRASQVGQIAPSHARRWDHRRRLALALALLRDECLDALISGELDFTELPTAMPAIAADGGAVLCHRVRYG